MRRRRTRYTLRARAPGARRSEHSEERSERQVTEQDEPRGGQVELERQLPVAVRKPQLGEHQRQGRARRSRPGPGARGRAARGSARAGTAARALPKTMNAQTAAAQARRSRSRSAGPRAYQTQTAITAATWSSVQTASALAAPPSRFWEPWLRLHRQVEAEELMRGEQDPEPRLSIWSGRPACTQNASKTPPGDRSANGRTIAAIKARNDTPQTSASRRPRVRQT